jgi:hypothetical protein
MFHIHFLLLNDEHKGTVLDRFFGPGDEPMGSFHMLSD